MTRKKLGLSEKSQQRISWLRDRLSRFDLVCSGTLIERMKRCGKSNCLCAKDPKALHGPYREWSRREGNRLAHTILSASEAQLIKQGIENYREIQKLLRKWEKASLKAIREID